MRRLPLSPQFVANALSVGDAGARWLEAIPELVAEAEHRWGVRVQEPFGLTYNFVAAAERADGSAAVLKIGFPGDPGFRCELEALRVFAGDGVCRLLAADDALSSMLLERVLPGTPLSTLADDDEATRISAQTIRRLRKPLPTGFRFGSIADLTRFIASYRAEFGRGGPVPVDLVERAAALFERLIRTSAEPVLTHGDLHQDNVLRSDARGWLAIDPKGIVAEPAYEVAAMIRNPYDRLRDVADLEPLLRRRLSLLAEALGHDERRLCEWCFAQTTLVAVTSAQGGAKSPEHAIRVAQVLSGMLI